MSDTDSLFYTKRIWKIGIFIQIIPKIIIENWRVRYIIIIENWRVRYSIIFIENWRVRYIIIIIENWRVRYIIIIIENWRVRYIIIFCLFISLMFCFYKFLRQIFFSEKYSPLPSLNCYITVVSSKLCVVLQYIDSIRTYPTSCAKL